VAALNVLAVMKAKGEKLSQLRDIIKEVPQILINARVKSRQELNDIEGYLELKNSIEKKLKGEGRLLVRFSGTENLVRVLVEGPDKKKITDYAQEMASFLEKKLN
jgi:phosphoglucosamine mutase